MRRLGLRYADTTGLGTWLKRNKIYFETIGQIVPILLALGISIAALVISIRANGISTHANDTQLQVLRLQRLQALPILRITVREPDYGSYVVAVSNTGAPITDWNVDIRPAFQAICGTPEHSLFSENALVYPTTVLLFDMYSMEGPNESLKLIAKDEWMLATVWDTVIFTLQDRQDMHSPELVFFVRVSYRDALDVRHKEFFKATAADGNTFRLDANNWQSVEAAPEVQVQELNARSRRQAGAEINKQIVSRCQSLAAQHSTTR